MPQYKNQTSFKKGMIPWNKGTKGICKPNSGSFKKGQLSLSKLPLGTITKRKDRNGTIRQWIKIEEPNIWIEYAKFIWTKYNGEIPKGFLIHHTKNALNDQIDNLALVTRKAHFEIHNIGKMGRDKMALNRIKNITPSLPFEE